jgi:two-component system sensor histidine kinase KdpD
LRHVLILGMLALLFVREATPGGWPFLYLVGLAVAALAAILTSPWAVLLYTLVADAAILWRTWPAGLGVLNLGTVVVTGFGATLAAFIFARAELLARQRALALERSAQLERERAEVLEQSKAALEARVIERTEHMRNFIATVSHDLRAPLTNIRVYAEAELQPEVALPAESRRSLEIILDETGVLVEHVNNLLFAAQIDAEALQPHPEALAADELVADVVARVRGRFLLAQRTLRVGVPADLPPVRADARFARMILGNLVDNAHKYSPPPAPIEIAGTLADGHVCIHVRDHGPGIPAAEREQLFERFRRGSTPGSSTGLGLGLWICRELAHNLGGEVDVTDAPGGGSVFTLRLPVCHDLSR